MLAQTFGTKVTVLGYQIVHSTNKIYSTYTVAEQILVFPVMKQQQHSLTSSQNCLFLLCFSINFFSPSPLKNSVAAL